jgi:hypothetical protein
MLGPAPVTPAFQTPTFNPFTRGQFVSRKSRASGHFEHTKRVADASGRCVSDIPKRVV